MNTGSSEKRRHHHNGWKNQPRQHIPGTQNVLHPSLQVRILLGLLSLRYTPTPLPPSPQTHVWEGQDPRVLRLGPETLPWSV